MLISFAKPYENTAGLGVDGSHQANLLVPLDSVRLVDAHRINPQHLGDIGLSNVSESRLEVRGGVEDLPAHVYRLCLACVPPDVRQSSEFWAVPQADCLQIA